jgi:hypothetical protein
LMSSMMVAAIARLWSMQPANRQPPVLLAHPG